MRLLTIFVSLSLSLYVCWRSFCIMHFIMFCPIYFVLKKNLEFITWSTIHKFEWNVFLGADCKTNFLNLHTEFGILSLYLLPERGCQPLEYSISMLLFQHRKSSPPLKSWQFWRAVFWGNWWYASTFKNNFSETWGETFFCIVIL